MPDFKDLLEVTIGKEKFWFRTPGPLQLAAVGSRALELRRRASPDTGGSEFGLDPISRDIYTGIAILETLLEKADCRDNWPFSVSEKGGRPAVDSSKFPPRASYVITEVSRAFYAALDEFLDDGDRDGVVSGEEVVDRSADLQALAVGTATPVGA